MTTICYFSKMLLRNYLKKKKRAECVSRVESAYSPRGVIDGYFFFFVGSVSSVIYATTTTTTPHSLSYISIPFPKNEALPQPSDANNNRERRYVAAQSLAVIHVDRTPTTTCLSLSLSFPHPHTSLYLLHRWAVGSCQCYFNPEASSQCFACFSPRFNHHSNEEETKQTTS